MTNIIRFMREVKQESQKVSWPSRQDVIRTTLTVFLAIAFISIVLLVADSLIAFLIELILGPAGR